MSPSTSVSPSPVNAAVGLDVSGGSASTGPSYSSPNSARQGAGEEMIESLGVALAGVNLATTGTGGKAAAANGNNNGSLFHGAASNEGASPYSSMAGTGPTQSTTESELAWSSTFSGSTAAPSTSQDNAAQQQPPKEGLELFLSQSPSQTLGEDVFKLSSTNLPALALEAERHQSNGETSPFHAGGGGSNTMPSGFPAQNGVIGRRRNDSPSGTGTTTSSRSVSPYATNTLNSEQRGGSIPAYNYSNNGAAAASTMNSGALLNSRQASYAEDDRQENSYPYGHAYSGSHPNLPALDHHAGAGNGQRYAGGQRRDGPKNLFGNVGANIPYDYDKQDGHGGAFMAQQQRVDVTASPQLQQQHAHPQQVPQQQPQVLYMAVPAPDGRGQVLQPVQIMQATGKPITYVVPQGASGIDPNQGMRVLPPIQQNNQGAGMVESRNPMVDHRNNKNYSLDTMSGKVDDYMYSNGDANKFNMAAGGAPQDPLYATTQRPPLDALLGQVRRLSRDQVGCRLVQQALDEEGPMAATLILNEGLPFWSEAMVDPFGNYLFQKILEKITPEERIMLVKTVSSRLVNASLNLHGTRSVQKIVELCSIDEENGVKAKASNGAEAREESAADILTRALSPAAARLCIDSHGNHVIQRILLKLGPKHSKFVFDAVAASVGDVARHRHGCCVIQRCLDSPDSESRSNLVHRIVDKSLELMQDAYGNYVVQYVLDVCSDHDVHLVCESVVGKVCLLAIQKFSSNVMEKCLERCTDNVKEMYLAELSDSDRIRELMMDPFGNYVVQRALSVATHSQAIRLVEAMRPHLVAAQPGFPNGQQRNGGVRNTAGGRRIMAKICRRFPNFTLSAVGSQEELFSQSKHQHRQPTHMMHGQGHGLATYAPMNAGPPRAQHQPQHQLYAGDPNAILGPHLAMNPQQAYYGEQTLGNMGNMGGMGYYDHFSGHGAFPNM